MTKLYAVNFLFSFEEFPLYNLKSSGVTPFSYATITQGMIKRLYWTLETAKPLFLSVCRELVLNIELKTLINEVVSEKAVFC